MWSFTTEGPPCCWSIGSHKTQNHSSRRLRQTLWCCWPSLTPFVSLPVCDVAICLSLFYQFGSQLCQPYRLTIGPWGNPHTNIQHDTYAPRLSCLDMSAVISVTSHSPQHIQQLSKLFFKIKHTLLCSFILTDTVFFFFFCFVISSIQLSGSPQIYESVLISCQLLVEFNARDEHICFGFRKKPTDRASHLQFVSDIDKIHWTAGWHVGLVAFDIVLHSQSEGVDTCSTPSVSADELTET